MNNTIVTWIVSMFYYLTTFLEGIVYQIASYSYKIFSLMCQLNFNSLYVILAPLMDRFKAIIIVLVLYNAAMALINLMMKPENVPAEGTKMLKNIAITVGLLLSYNLIFSVMNELSMLILGTPEGYSYTVLNDLAGVTGGEDEGLLMRFVFGENKDIGEVGDFVVYSAMSVFVQNTSATDEVGAALADGDNINFMNLYTLVPKIGKTVSYFPGVGIILGGFLVYTFFNLAAEVGIRVFKLLVLQLIAPLAIITIVYKGWDGSIFKSKYIPCYISVFTGIFIRIVTTFVVTVFISKFVKNIGSFFSGVQWGDEWYTSGLVLAIIIFAGYKFVLEVPRFIEQALGAKIDGFGKSDGFANVLGATLVGGAAGLATGMVGGALSGGGPGSRILGALSGGVSGALGGVAGGINGGKGQTIANSIKTAQTNSRKRTDGWKAKGGYGNQVRSDFNNGLHITKLQDARMNRFQNQNDLLDKLEKEQEKELSKQTVSANDYKDASGNLLFESRYALDYAGISFAGGQSSFEQAVVSQDRDVRTAEQAYQAAIKSNDAGMINKARSDLTARQNEAKDRAKKLYEEKMKNTKSQEVLDARKEANKALGNGKKTDYIDIASTKKQIAAKQQVIQGRKGYQAAHKGDKK